MKKVILFLLFQATIFSLGFGQKNFIPSKTKTYQSLTGTIYILPFFVETPGNPWEDAEISYFKQILKQSENWLIQEADFYDQELEFINDHFFLSQESIFLESVTMANSRVALQKIMEELRYEDFDDFLEQQNFDLKENKLKVVLFVKSNSRSHAYNFWSNSVVDIAIVYCGTSFIITNQYVIAHEILHQFGAWDLYFGESQSLEKAKKAKELYPNSIMINTRRNHSEIEVDELTAWRVGWHLDFKEEYNEFQPIRKKRRSDKGKSLQFRFGKKKQKEEEN